MKKIVILIGLCLVMDLAYSQKGSPMESKPAAAISEKQQKIELKKAQKEAASKKIEEMILTRQFILEVNFVRDQSGNLLNTAARINVSSSLNYLAINLNKVVLQLAPSQYQTSNWPFGDFALNGVISQYNFRELKKPDEGYIVRYHTDGRIGTYDITYNISSDGKTTLRLESNNGITLNFEGIIVPLNKSRIKPVFI
jgi:hypothetical protein